MKSSMLITVSNFGRIPQLHQNGPIITPLKVGVDTVVDLVRRQYTVYEHNKYNPEKKVLLTVHNLMNDNFPIVEKQPAPAEVQITPTVQVEEIPSADLSTPVEEPVEVSPVVEEPVAEKASEKAETQASLRDKAASLGIDTTGMSKNKIRAAIRDAESASAKA